MFDIKVQNDSISGLVKAQIMGEFKELQGLRNWKASTSARLRIIANRRAEAANPRWVENVRACK